MPRYPDTITFATRLLQVAHPHAPRHDCDSLGRYTSGIMFYDRTRATIWVDGWGPHGAIASHISDAHLELCFMIEHVRPSGLGVGGPMVLSLPTYPSLLVIILVWGGCGPVNLRCWMRCLLLARAHMGASCRCFRAELNNVRCHH